jgi:hypothetical protein
VTAETPLRQNGTADEGRPCVLATWGRRDEPDPTHDGADPDPPGVELDIVQSAGDQPTGLGVVTEAHDADGVVVQHGVVAVAVRRRDRRCRLVLVESHPTDVGIDRPVETCRGRREHPDQPVGCETPTGFDGCR